VGGGAIARGGQIGERLRAESIDVPWPVIDNGATWPKSMSVESAETGYSTVAVVRQSRTTSADLFDRAGTHSDITDPLLL
jgi:hypothetical protein